MMITVILVILLALALLTLGFVVIRKLPQLKVVDPLSSREAQARGLKQDILRQRFARATERPVSALGRVAGAPLGFLQGIVRRVAAKLKAVERSYADKQQTRKAKLGTVEIRRIIDDAEALVNKGSHDEAEKKLVELLSLDPKNVEGYEVLGRLYILTKDYVNAKETFTYLLKLSPKDASVLASLGEIAESEGDEKAAYTYFEKAKDASPNNPKYLDFFINAAIINENYYEAERSLTKLEQVNPENQKIAVFAERIAEERKKATKETK